MYSMLKLKFCVNCFPDVGLRDLKVVSSYSCIFIFLLVSLAVSCSKFELYLIAFTCKGKEICISTLRTQIHELDPLGAVAQHMQHDLEYRSQSLA